MNTLYMNTPRHSLIVSSTEMFLLIESSVTESVNIVYDEPLSMRTAILTGLYGNENDPSTVSGSCPTPNCTWHPYTSLAFCPSLVENVSSTIQKQCVNLTFGDDDTQYTFCNVTTNNLAVNSISGVSCPSENIGVYSVSQNVFGKDTNSSTTSNDGKTELKLVDIFAIYQKTENSSSLDSINAFKSCQSSEFIALKASISLCLQTFQTSMTNGSTNTTVVENHTTLGWNGLPLDMDPVLEDISYPVWTQIDGDSQNYTSDSHTIKFLVDALQFQVFHGAAIIQGNIMSLLRSDEDVSDGTISVALALFGPKLENSNDLPSSIMAFQNLLSNFTSAMTNVYARYAPGT
jgi:hypothetical protein